MSVRQTDGATARQPHCGARRPLRGVLIGTVMLSGIGLLAFVTLALYVVPQADDLCYANYWRKYGLFDGVANIYQTLSGRFVTSTIIMLPNALETNTGLDWLFVHSAISIIIIALYAAFSLWLIGRFLPLVPSGIRISISVVFLFSLLANARSVRDLLYWLSQTANYAIAGLVFLTIFIVLHHSMISRRPVGGPTVALLLPGVFLAGGTHELAGGLLLIAIVTSASVRRATPGVPVQPLAHLLLAVAAVAAFAIVYLAPGNAARASAYPNHGDLIGSFLWGLLLLIEFVFRRMTYPGTLGWLLLVFLLSQVYGRQVGPRLRLTPLLTWYPIGLFLAAGFFVFAAGYYGQGSPIPARAQNLVYLVGFITFTAVVFAAGRSHGGSVRRWVRRRYPAVTFRRAVLAGVVLLVGSPGLYHAMAALDGAATLRTDMRARVDLLAAAEPDRHVTVPALAAPSLLLIEDMREDPEFWINRCYADLFDVAAVSASAPAAE